MALWTSREADEATGGISTQPWEATGVSIDTRSLQPGDLFVALADQRDGHDFVAAALAKGASAALVTHRPSDVPEDAPLLVVGRALEALEALAVASRARMKGQVIAVTGSVGKTSTKDMLLKALEPQGRVHAAEKSYNNHWGVPLTLARMPADTEFAVIEIGMNHPGEITPLSRLSRPHVAIVTTVAAAHMQAFTSVRDIAKAKAEIFAGLADGGVAILNRDIATYPILDRAAKRAGARRVRFGYAGRPEFALKLVRQSGGTTTVTARHEGAKLAFKIGAPGAHLAMNALAVLAATDAVGADMARAALSLAQWTPPEGRGTQMDVGLGNPPGMDGSIRLIDESYNANPSSMEAALDVLAASEVANGPGRVARGRRIAILGDMLELGASEVAAHEELARLGAIDHVDQVHVVGPLMGAMHRALDASRRGLQAATAKEIVTALPHILDAGDVVMVKGSNGIGLKGVVDAIKKLGQSRPTKTTYGG